MTTDELRGKIRKVWEQFWTGGLISVFDQQQASKVIPVIYAVNNKVEIV